MRPLVSDHAGADECSSRIPIMRSPTSSRRWRNSAYARCSTARAAARPRSLRRGGGEAAERSSVPLSSWGGSRVTEADVVEIVPKRNCVSRPMSGLSLAGRAWNGKARLVVPARRPRTIGGPASGCGCRVSCETPARCVVREIGYTRAHDPREAAVPFVVRLDRLAPRVGAVFTDSHGDEQVLVAGSREPT